MVGAFLDNHNSQSDSGSIYTYLKDQSGGWTFQSIINLGSASSDNDYFGFALAMNARYLVIGGFRRGSRGDNSFTNKLVCRELNCKCRKHVEIRNP